MDKKCFNKNILILSLPLCFLTVIASCIGWFTPGFYSAETINWQAQSAGQDMIDLFLIAPSLLITSIVSYKKNRAATTMWGGVVLYLTYTFTLYCFDVHFNKLFVLYCICLGLSFYSTMYFLLMHCKENSKSNFESNSLLRIIGIYFLLVSVLFYFLWLSEIIPAIIQHTIPKSLAEAGLFTNGVHVIDLGIFLPGVFITGILLLRRSTLGLILTPAFLTFFVLMDITIGALVAIMKMRGIESNLILTTIMGTLALVSLLLLILYFKKTKAVTIQ